MKTNQLILLKCMLILTFGVSAQTVQFHVDAGVNRYGEDSYTETGDFPSQRWQFINDTTQVISSGVATFEQTHFFTPEVGYEISLSASISLNSRWRITTGLGLQYNRMGYERDFGSNTFIAYKSDTVIVQPPPTSQGAFSDCSFSINQPADLPEPDADLDLVLTDLVVPVGIEYEILPDRLSVNVGGAIQTPLIAESTYETIDVNRTYNPGEIICEFVIREREYRPLTRVNPLRVSLQTMVRYDVLPGMKINAGLRGMLSNTFRYHDNDNFNRLEFQSAGYFFGISYLIGKKNLTNPANTGQ